MGKSTTVLCAFFSFIPSMPAERTKAEAISSNSVAGPSTTASTSGSAMPSPTRYTPRYMSPVPCSRTCPGYLQE
ncbi:hypothetical protein BV22DRAFT_1042260 [Leucogyrophana mollusca]|uniref:Uncharacterized protein n=1 Tax=Leucogyrophana mollusca TaxID=85980 RepID=A0ACB8AYK2_9AGAM|nr:hypothetical protein BV22DRAFT_1042260 [Leucogyrophana mollusca]